jgi:hypothetical protein
LDFTLKVITDPMQQKIIKKIKIQQITGLHESAQYGLRREKTEAGREVS